MPRGRGVLPKGPRHAWGSGQYSPGGPGGEAPKTTPRAWDPAPATAGSLPGTLPGGPGAAGVGGGRDYPQPFTGVAAFASGLGRATRIGFIFEVAYLLFIRIIF